MRDTPIVKKPFLFHRLFNLQNITLNNNKLSPIQLISFLFIVLTTIIIKLLIINFNMIDHGEGATRTWNAYWWAIKPFFVEPLSGNPGWFYVIGPLIMITHEIYYTPIVTMIIAMTIAGIYIFKITLLFGGYRTALLAFIIFTLNPVIFRLNFMPIPQQLYLAAICVMIYYFIKAVVSENESESFKYFIISGVFSFISLLFRPEGLFILLAFCLIAINSRKKGSYYFVIISLLFQVFWMYISFNMYGSFFKTFTAVREYDFMVGGNIEGWNLKTRLTGFISPFYFIFIGTTVILFWFLVKGIYAAYKRNSLLVFAIILVPFLLPALINGLYSSISALYLTTRYFYLTFFIASVFTAIGLDEFISKFKSGILKYSLASLIIISAIPLSYIKDFVPSAYSRFFPKVIQFIATSEDPTDVRQLLNIIDKYITSYPALIFDEEGSDSSILTVPFRTKLAPPDKVLISGYNVPSEKDELTNEIRLFMKRNPKGLIIYKKDPNTIMHSIFSELTAKRPYLRNGINYISETDKWIVLSYEPAENSE